MKTYIITATNTTYYTNEIKAESLEEAEKLAWLAEGGDFAQDGLGDWEIVKVQEAS